MVTATWGRSATSNPATNTIQLLDLAKTGSVVITSLLFPFFFLCPTQSGSWAGLGSTQPPPHIKCGCSSFCFSDLVWSSFPAGMVGIISTKVCCFTVQVRGYSCAERFLLSLQVWWSQLTVSLPPCNEQKRILSSFYQKKSPVKIEARLLTPVHASLKMSEYSHKPEIFWRSTSGPRSRRRDFQNQTFVHVSHCYKPFCPFLPFLC